MKTMTCRQLGGGCDMQFHASSFEEIAELSKKHGREMHLKGDKDHLDAFESMHILMKSPDAMQAWFQAKRNVFNSLPEQEVM